MSRILTLALIALFAASSLVLVGSVSAHSIPKPSVPEFTVSVTDHSYDVQATTTTTTDPYDGQLTTQTAPSYRVITGTIELSIKNQPFTTYYDSNGYPIKLYYNIRYKGAEPANWVCSDFYFPATISTYTPATIEYSGSSLSISSGYIPGVPGAGFRPDGTLDIQVQAFIGYMNVTNINPADFYVRPGDLITEFVGQTGDWSDSQTATVPNGAYTLIIQNPTTPPTPTVAATPWPYQDSTVSPSETLTGSSSTGPQYSSLEIALVLVVVAVFAFLVAVIFVMRRKMKVLELKQNGT
jgi:hypothetical protein